MLALIVSTALGVLAGAVAALKIIAPKTKTTVDDTVLARLEALEKMVEGLGGKLT